MDTKKLALGLLIALSTCTTLPAIAGPTLVNFDTYPNGSAVSCGTVITNQWSSVGVTFSSPSGPLTSICDNEWSSPPNALAGIDPATQSGIWPITADFSSPYPTSVNVNLISLGCATDTVKAYAPDLVTVVASQSLTNGPSAGNGFAQVNPIFLSAGQIARVTFVITTPCLIGTTPDGVGIDDFSFTAAQSSSTVTDVPIPLWALTALGAGLIGIASRGTKKAT